MRLYSKLEVCKEIQRQRHIFGEDVQLRLTMADSTKELFNYHDTMSYMGVPFRIDNELKCNEYILLKIGNSYAHRKD